MDVSNISVEHSKLDNFDNDLGEGMSQRVCLTAQKRIGASNSLSKKNYGSHDEISSQKVIFFIKFSILGEK